MLCANREPFLSVKVEVVGKVEMVESLVDDEADKLGKIQLQEEVTYGDAGIVKVECVNIGVRRVIGCLTDTLDSVRRWQVTQN